MRRSVLAVATMLAVVMLAVGQVPWGRVTGTVTDAQGRALPGVTVTLASQATGATKQVVTDQSGSYLIVNVPPGQDYTLTFALPDYETVRVAALAVARGETLAVNHAMAETLVPHLTPGTISGRVMDSTDTRLGGVTVVLTRAGMSASRTAVTTEQGTYQFDQVAPAQDYELTFEKALYERVVISPVVVVDGQDARHDVTMTAPGLVREHEEPDLVTRIDLPGDCEQPAGVAWDGVFLWVTDHAKGDVWRIDARTARDEAPMHVSLGLARPGPLVFDRTHQNLWVVDDPEARIRRRPGGLPSTRRQPRIYQFTLDETTPEPTLRDRRSIPVTWRADTGPITGIAWDGSTLWMSMGGGLCACVYRLDPETGDVLLSFFPRCDPAGLAITATDLLLIDSNRTTRMKVAAKGPVLLRRSFVGQRSLDGTTLAHNGLAPSLLRTQTFRRVGGAGRPRGIAADGSNVWVLNPDGRSITRVSLPEPE